MNEQEQKQRHDPAAEAEPPVADGEQRMEAGTAEEARDRGATAADEAEGADLSFLRRRNEELEAEVADLRDRFLRAAAEIENVRRRSARDVEDTRNYAVTGIARDLLNVADNLRRALDSVAPEAREQDEYLARLAEGVEMTERELLSVFDRHRIRKVVPEGERFDHNLHQAMFEVETADHAPGTVVQVLQPGYVIADRLLRPAMVGVAKAPPAPQPPQDGAEQPQEPGSRIDTTA
jgi:molecular chaperone GrpE